MLLRLFFYAQGCAMYIAALQHAPRAASMEKLSLLDY